jgi:hypothetical protein
MTTMQKSFTSLALILITFTGIAQTTGIGQWRDHLPYSNCISVKEVGSRIYGATPYSVFYFDKDDNSIQRINKVNGLSDIGITAMNYSSVSKTVVIAYQNANIDLIKNNTIINISDIKRASILGNKTINDIHFIGPYAYLSCGFGIVVLDVEKEEIHDTYYIGANGAQVNVLGLTKSDDDTLFAATEKGVYLADAKSQNLANFQNWRIDSRLNSQAKYDNIITFNGQVIVSQYRPTPAGDTLRRLANGKWTKWILDFSNPVQHMESTYGKLVISSDHFVKYFDSDFNRIGEVYTYNGVWPWPLDAIFDNSGQLWIGDKNAGMLYLDPGGNIRPIELSGPLSSLVFAITPYANDIYVVPGGRDASYVPLSNQPAIYHYNSTTWTNMNAATDPGMSNLYNLSTITVDPGDPRRIYSGSWGKGLGEFYDGKFVTRYGYWNSTLRNHSASDTGDIRVGGTAFDSEGNLWVVNTANNQCISRYCRTCPAGSQWTGYNVPIINQDDLGQMIIDNGNQKWVVMRITPAVTSPLLVFKEDPKNPANSKSKLLSSQKGSGNVPGQAVFAMACDKNGQVWVGTEKGIGVFFNPENIFTGQDYDAQQILVQQGAYVQYLMEDEKVCTCSPKTVRNRSHTLQQTTVRCCRTTSSDSPSARKPGRCLSAPTRAWFPTRAQQQKVAKPSVMFMPIRIPSRKIMTV